MRVRLLLFASAREAAGGVCEVQLDVLNGSTAADALSAALTRFPGLAPLRPCLQLAVNQKYALPESPVAEGDEVALIPPISGG
jgi:molybdopterin synthase catalytic subunit